MIRLLEQIARFVGASPASTTGSEPPLQDAEQLARQLEAHPGYRVLRALNPDAGVETLSPRTGAERIAAVIDTETTGLDPEADRVIEVAVQRFSFDRAGSVIQIERPRSWLEDPQRPLPPSIARLTGISDEDLQGRRFDEDAIVALVNGADIIIAHNAAFDRPFLDRRFPQLQDHAWACSLSQLDWQDLGYDGRALGHLLVQSGRFFEGHRAANDTNALVSLLGTAGTDGRTVLAHLLDHCERDSTRVDATGAPFEAKDKLKGAGYRWDATRRLWWREVQPQDLPGETEWLHEQVYQGRGQPTLRTITPRQRFRRDDTSG